MFTIEMKTMNKINSIVENKTLVKLPIQEASAGRGCSAMRCSGSCGVLIR
jgi:hypothetical protein